MIVCWILISTFLRGIFAQTLFATNYIGKYELTMYSASVSFIEAKDFCRTKNANLVRIDSQVVTDAIVETIKNRGEDAFWIGATDQSTEGTWKWLDDTAIIKTQWSSGEPNNAGGRPGEDCAAISQNGKWNDVNCASGINFVCQGSVFTYDVHKFTLNGIDSEKSSFFDANEKCRAQNSRLVEMVNQTINTALRNYIGSDSDRVYWTGGSDLKNNMWHWNNQSLVSRAFGWRNGEPNGQNEHCLVIEKQGLADYECNRNMHFICETVQTSEVTIKPTMVEVNSNNSSSSTAICTASGFPIPIISWWRGSNQVSSTSHTMIYQRLDTESLTLFVRNASLMDEGNYTCKASNVIDKTNYSSTASFVLKVPSIPLIHSAKPSSCNSSLTISWSSHKRAIGVNHSINAWTKTPSNANGNITVYTTQHNPDFASLEMKTLLASTEYIITITPCPNECKPEYNTTTTVYTGGIPRQLINVDVVQINTTSCIISWKWPQGATRDLIEGHKIYSIATIAVLSSGATVWNVEKTAIDTGKELTFIHTGLPNRNYSFNVQAKSCAGVGSSVRATGSCITDIQSPAHISTPIVKEIISDEGKATLGLQPPDQSNGPISCLFIIVGPENESKQRKIANLSDLLNANQSSGNREYIAVSLAASRLKDTTSIVIGDQTTSSCDVSSTRLRKRRSTGGENVFIGNNVKLDSNRNYSVTTVSTTPSNGTILFHSSEPLGLVMPSKTNSSRLIIIIVVAILGALLLLIFVVILLVLKRRKLARKPAPQTHPQDQAPQHTTDGASQEKVIYENTMFANDQRVNRSKTDISMTSFEELYKNMLKNDGTQFIEQFQKLLQDATKNLGETKIALNPEFKKKNRYKNILPFDKTRVHIENSETGYINACYVDGFEKKRKFIATQGPLPTTVNDFWLMIVEQKCSVIIMLAKCVEAGKRKCQKYWPEPQETIQFGPVTVINNEEIRFCGFVRRTLSVSAELQDDQIVMTVHQYHFRKWPDHGVPPTTSHLARMHKEAMQTHNAELKDAPILIHCSAGAGRTGTFVGYDNLIEESRKLDRADVYQCVVNMRTQRVEMVQNCDQYVLVHKLLLEFHLFGDTDLTTADFVDKFADNDQRTKTAQEEFNNLNKIEPLKISYSKKRQDAAGNDNTKRAPHISQSKLKIVIEGDASFIESYDESSAMIAAEGPTETTTRQFWQLVLDQNVGTIVMLNDIAHENSVKYWPSNVGETINLGKIQVTLTVINKCDSFVKRGLNVTGSDKKRVVTHLQYIGWREQNCPTNAKQVISLVDQMQKSLRETNSSVALIHCSDGVGRTGTFCAIVNLIERLKVENKVDVFRTVKDLRDCRPGMVKSLDQYLFCQLAVIDYLNSFDIYSNFR